MLYDLDYGTDGGGEDQRVINGQEIEDIEFHEQYEIKCEPTLQRTVQ